MVSIATDDLEPPALSCGYGGEDETVDFVAQAVASIDFEPPALSCGYGGEREVDAEDLRKRDVVVDAPHLRLPSPPINALPTTPSRGAHLRLPPTPAEVDWDVDDAGADGAVDDDDVGDEDDAGDFVAVPTPSRRRVLRHPLLTPLTRLPWDRMISAAGSCDILFNCKYSARQMEDEVREDRHRTAGNSVDVPSYPVATRADGYANLSLGHEYEEAFEYECCAGREDGSYRVIDDEEMEERGEGVECDAEEFAKLGLDCCSMLDDDGHDAEEVEVVACVPLLRLLGREQSNVSAVANEEEEGREEEGGEEEEEEGHWEQAKQAADDGNVEFGTTPSDTISSADQKAEVSWKNSNPSLDDVN